MSELIVTIVGEQGDPGKKTLVGSVDPVAAPTGLYMYYYNKVTTAYFEWNGAAWDYKGSVLNISLIKRARQRAQIIATGNY